MEGQPLSHHQYHRHVFVLCPSLALAIPSRPGRGGAARRAYALRREKASILSRFVPLSALDPGPGHGVHPLPPPAEKDFLCYTTRSVPGSTSRIYPASLSRRRCWTTERFGVDDSLRGNIVSTVDSIPPRPSSLTARKQKKMPAVGGNKHSTTTSSLRMGLKHVPDSAHACNLVMYAL